MLDIVIINVPGTISQHPPAAPALLKASVVSAGYSCKTIDFNIRFYKTIKKELLNDLESYFSTGLNQEFAESANNLIKEWAEEIIQLQPKYVGISVFTYQNRTATELFCKYLKAHSNVKIIVGGQGLADGGILGGQGFAKKLLKDNLIDFYIKSEGERSLVELLNGNLSYYGINSEEFDQITDLSLLPLPDYSDYNLSDYSIFALPVTASRGCVRACTFCDIHEHWKYKYRSGDSVAKEIITLHKLHGVNHFLFTDSLVNGNLKEFKIFCKILSEYNKLSDTKIKWSGQYIVHNMRHLNETYWENLAGAGADRLAIGVETGSDSVRLHMKKKFSNVDLDHTVSMLEKYNITCVFLMIVGYPTETEQDFNDTLTMFTRYSHLAQKIIIDIAIGSTLGILPGTPLYKHAADYRIELDKHENNWIALDNISLTLTERLLRIKRLKKHLKEQGYYFNDDGDNIIKIIENNLPIFEKRNNIKKMIQIKKDTNNG